jgi:hypothetical protein
MCFKAVARTAPFFRSVSETWKVIPIVKCQVSEVGVARRPALVEIDA